MPTRTRIKTYLVDTLYFVGGSILYALAIYTFALHADFAPGGISGLAIILNHYTGWPVGVLTLVMNVPIILLCAKTLGHSFLLKSIWTMLINTFFVDIVFPHFPVYMGNPLLAAMFTGVLLGAGMSLIYMRGSSTGGADFVVMTVKKLRPHFSIGQITMAFDSVVILLGGLVFKNVDAVLYGIIAVFVSTLAIDNILYGIGASKLAIIITNHGQQIADGIANETDRGSTLVQATGTYTGEGREMLYCACAKSEIYKVRTAALAIDPNALFMVTEASEVFGEGFAPPALPGNEIPAKKANDSTTDEAK